MRTPKLIPAAVTAALFAVAAPVAHAAPVDHDTLPAVCNEAENSWQGGYTVTGDPVDPNPPARLRGSQMKVGNGVGLVNAAAHSPALRTCAPADGTGGGGTDDGGGPITAT